MRLRVRQLYRFNSAIDTYVSIVCNILWDLFTSLLYTLISITSPNGQLVYLLQSVKKFTTNVNNAMRICGHYIYTENFFHHLYNPLRAIFQCHNHECSVTKLTDLLALSFKNNHFYSLKIRKSMYSTTFLPNF